VTEPAEHSSRPANGGDVYTVRGIYAYFERWLLDKEKFDDERDRRYGERHIANQTAVDAAFQAAKEASSMALSSQEKAITKAEDSQKSYNTSHNDLLRKMDEQHKETLPRLEADGRFVTQAQKIEDARIIASAAVPRGEFVLLTKTVADLTLEVGKLREHELGRKEGTAPYTALILAVTGSVGGALLLHYLLTPK
jgi:hypothetical protein